MYVQGSFTEIHKLLESDWLIPTAPREAIREEWKCFITELGALYVTMGGHTSTPELLAGEQREWAAMLQ